MAFYTVLMKLAMIKFKVNTKLVNLKPTEMIIPANEKSFSYEIPGIFYKTYVYKNIGFLSKMLKRIQGWSDRFFEIVCFDELAYSSFI